MDKERLPLDHAPAARPVPLCEGGGMTCVSCSVFPTAAGEWVAHVEQGQVGPYRTQDIALQVATAEALRLSRSGKPARVTVRDRAGNARAERCLCSKFSQLRIGCA